VVSLHRIRDGIPVRHRWRLCKTLPNGCTADTHNIDNAHLRSSYRGFRSRGNITWHVTDDAMVYYTFSQGFRPGGFNRTVSGVAKGPEGTAQFEKPAGYAPDSLTITRSAGKRNSSITPAGQRLPVLHELG